MKRDWLKQQLGEAATDELVDAIMAANGRDVNAANAKGEALRSQLEEANAKVGELTEQASGKLSEAEKWQRELEKANKRADEAVRELNETSAVAVFAKAGLTEEEYSPLLGSVVSGDRDRTVASAQAIADLVSGKVAAAREQAGKDALGKMAPPAGGEPSASVTTVGEFLALPYDQQLSLKRANPGIIQQLKQ